MTKFNEYLQELEAKIKGFTTADNAEDVTAAVKSLETLRNEHERVEKEKRELSDKIVDIVKNTAFVQPSAGADPTETQKVPTFEDALNASILKIEKEKK